MKRVADPSKDKQNRSTMASLFAERSEKVTQVVKVDFGRSGGSDVSRCVADIEAKGAKKNAPIRRRTFQQKEREERSSRVLPDHQKGPTPVEEGRTSTVVFDLIKGSGACTFETAARFSLESGLSAPAIPRSAKNNIQNSRRDFSFL